MIFVMYADFSQIVLLDVDVKLDEVHAVPFWSSENVATDLFSSRAGARAVSIATPGKGEILVEISVLETVPDASDAIWARTDECRLELPSGRLGIAEILELEHPVHLLEFAPDSYRLRASLSGWDWDAPIAVPAELMPEGVEAVYQRVKLELWPAQPRLQRSS